MAAVFALSKISRQCAACTADLAGAGVSQLASTRNTSESLRNHRPLDHILELANIARPVIRLEQIERVLTDTPNSLASFLRVSFDQIFHEQWDVTAPITKRGHLKSERH